MPKKDLTAGESLCSFLKNSVIDPTIWPAFITALAATGRSEELAEFVGELIAAQMTGRLVIAGKAIARSLGGMPAVGGIDFRYRLKTVVEDSTDGILSKPARFKLQDLVERAVFATYGGGLNEDEQKEVLDEAGRPPRCFLCNRRLVMIRGPRAEELPPDDRGLAVEDEHVWPRSFGGDTVVGNIALACHRCNQAKENYTNWAIANVQSLIAGVIDDSDRDEEPTQAIRAIDWTHRFAIASRTALRMADRKSLTLKQAHLRIRDSVLPHPKQRSGRRDPVADFFNLVNHTEDE